MEEDKLKTLQKLKPKQIEALELLTNGLAMTYNQIAEQLGIHRDTLWSWRKKPEFKYFQDAYQALLDEKWESMLQVALNSMANLSESGHFQASEFILKNYGYNPALKVEGRLDNAVEIVIGPPAIKDALPEPEPIYLEVLDDNEEDGETKD